MRQRTLAEGVARHTVAWIYCTAYVPLLMVVCTLTPGRRLRERVWPAMARSWGRTMMRIAGVGLEIDASVHRHLADRRGRVLLFNHSSTLDTFIGAAVLPAGGVLVLKREFFFLPFLGQATWLVGSVFVDRRDGDKARASLAAAAGRTAERDLQVLIAPEGTRMKGPDLGRFKLGGFRFARDADIPLVPIVIHRAQDIWPIGDFAPGGGTVRVTALDPCTVHGADEAKLREIADGVRDAYIAELGRTGP